ncbi:MAG: hypothetical protein HQK55_01960 [Deltaproteobacteria bacterium]|nr:hypothetical protein [Deltaproteobacteria bacterium]
MSRIPLNTGRPENGNQDFWELLARIEPTSPVRLFQAKALLAMNNPGAALAVAEAVLTAHPESLTAITIKARALIMDQDVASARQALAGVPAILEQTSLELTDLAELYQQIGDRPAAERINQAARFLSVEGPAEKETEKTLAETSAKNVPEEKECAEAIPTETLALLYLNQGHPDQALDIYLKLAADSPRDTRWPAKIAELTALKPSTAHMVDLPVVPPPLTAVSESSLDALLTIHDRPIQPVETRPSEVTTGQKPPSRSEVEPAAPTPIRPQFESAGLTDNNWSDQAPETAQFSRPTTPANLMTEPGGSSAVILERKKRLTTKLTRLRDAATRLRRSSETVS